MSTNHLSELTVEELRLLLREEMRALIRETVQEVLDKLIDDEADIKFRPDIEAQLQIFLRDQPDGEPINDILDELDLNSD